MKIETKFDIDQEVFIISNNIIKKASVSKMDIYILVNPVITYSLSSLGDYTESKIFETKQEAKDFLIKKIQEM